MSDDHDDDGQADQQIYLDPTCPHCGQHPVFGHLNVCPVNANSDG